MINRLKSMWRVYLMLAILIILATAVPYYNDVRHGTVEKSIKSYDTEQHDYVANLSYAEYLEIKKDLQEIKTMLKNGT